MKKIVFLCCTLIFSLAIFISCEEPDEEIIEYIPVLEIGENKVEMFVGDKYTLQYQILENNQVVEKEVIIKSLNEDICVIEDNKVVAQKSGNCAISVCIKDYPNSEDFVNVVVKEKLTSLLIKGPSIVEIGKSEIFTKEFTPSKAEYDLIWSTSDEAIATIDENGIMKALKAGEVTLFLEDKVSLLKAELKVEVINLNDYLLDWAFGQLGTEAIDDVNLPDTHPQYDCEFIWTSSDNEMLDTEEKILGFCEFDTTIQVTCKVNYNNNSLERTADFIVIGYGLKKIADDFASQFKGNKILQNIDLITSYNKYGGTTIKWESSDTNILLNTGIFNKPNQDTYITITYKVMTTEPRIVKSYEIEILAVGKDLTDKLDDVKKWIKENVGENGMLTEDTYLPTYCDEYDVNIGWYDNLGNELNIEKLTGNPILSNVIIIKIYDSSRSLKYEAFYNVKPKNMDMWDTIKLFTDTIAKSNLQTYRYSLVSWQAQEKGYLPFYDSKDANITQSILEYTYGNQRTGIMKTSTEYIVVHDTGNPSSGADALMHNRYITNLNESESSTSISWHFTVDDSSIYQHLPLDEVAYHAGDGSRVFGDTYFNTTYNADSIGGGNRNGIGIESCIDEGSDYTETMRILAKLVAELLIKYDLGIDRIKQHNAFSGKNCPQVMRENNRWNEFIYLVQLEYFAKKYLKGVEFKWTSLTDGFNDTGKVIVNPVVGMKVDYKVEATYNGKTETYTYSSVLKQR